MGYSHSWIRPRSIAPSSFNAIARDFTSLLPALELAGSHLANPHGREEPEITSEFIGFNGVAGCGHTLNPNVRLPWPIGSARGVGNNAGQRGALPYRTCNGDCSYESLWFERVQDGEQSEDQVFSATKTAFRPYDLAVTAFLVVVKHHLRSEILVESDGRPCQWADALAICQEVLGYGQRFVLVKRVPGVCGGSVRMTIRIAYSLGLDAANQQMRAANRSAWNEQDAALAASTLNRYFPLCAELPGVAPEVCGCIRCVPQIRQQMTFFSDESF